MDIKEVNSKIVTLEKVLFDVISNFEEETCTFVDNVRLNRLIERGGFDDKLSTVDFDVKLRGY